jgi:uncharacterized membrane protein YdjX (TVP38/TMEM64 family)/rhodanese-related sulfurtransferase
MNRTAARLLLFAVLAAAVAWAFAFRDRLDPAALQTWIGGFGAWGVVLFVLAFAAGTVLFLPGTLFALAGGALFGPVLGTVYNLTGATLGAAVAFLAARYLAGDWVAGRAGSRLGRLVAGVEAEGWRFVAFTRLVPLFPFNLLNYALGLTRISFGAYVAATAVCMIPGGLAYTYLGYAGREALAGGEGTIRNGAIALGLLAASLFLPRLVKRLRQAPALDIGDLTPGEAMLVLDVRDAPDFAGGHVPASRNIPLPELAARLGELEDWRGGMVAVLCRTDKRSAKAVEMLKAEGFSGVRLVAGGMVEWGKRGLPVEEGP